MPNLDWFALAVGAVIVVALLWSLSYILIVVLGEHALRSGVPKTERVHTFVGTPTGDGYFAPTRAFAYFRDGGFTAQADPAVVRRSARVQALVRVNDALTYPAIIGGAALLLANWLGA